MSSPLPPQKKIGMGKLFHPGSPANNDCIDPHPNGNDRVKWPVKCLSWSTEFVTAAPANISALGDKPTNITSCNGDECQFVRIR